MTKTRDEIIDGVVHDVMFNRLDGQYEYVISCFGQVNWTGHDNTLHVRHDEPSYYTVVPPLSRDSGFLPNEMHVKNLRKAVEYWAERIGSSNQLGAKPT